MTPKILIEFRLECVLLKDAKNTNVVVNVNDRCEFGIRLVILARNWSRLWVSHSRIYMIISFSI